MKCKASEVGNEVQTTVEMQYNFYFFVVSSVCTCVRDSQQGAEGSWHWGNLALLGGSRPYPATSK